MKPKSANEWRWRGAWEITILLHFAEKYRSLFFFFFPPFSFFLLTFVCVERELLKKPQLGLYASELKQALSV